MEKTTTDAIQTAVGNELAVATKKRNLAIIMSNTLKQKQNKNVQQLSHMQREQRIQQNKWCYSAL